MPPPPAITKSAEPLLTDAGRRLAGAPVPAWQVPTGRHRRTDIGQATDIDRWRVNADDYFEAPARFQPSTRGMPVAPLSLPRAKGDGHSAAAARTAAWRGLAAYAVIYAVLIAVLAWKVVLPAWSMQP